jgi:hypothetical protein
MVQVASVAVMRRSWCRKAHSTLRGKALVNHELQKWSQSLSGEAALELYRQGFLVIENVFDPGLTRALRDEILELHFNEELYSNATHIFVQGQSTPLLLQKKHICETELFCVPPRHHCLQAWFENSTILQAANKMLPHLNAERHMIKALLSTSSTILTWCGRRFNTTKARVAVSQCISTPMAMMANALLRYCI